MTSLLSEQNTSFADPAFVTLACSWTHDPAQQLLGFVWAAYDKMRAHSPVIDSRDLERSITQLLEPRVRAEMTGDEPFYIQHGPFERETMKAPPAQPPEYDLAFVLRADERIMWPLEAKVLETPNQTAAYERDVRKEYLTCRYAPFSSSGAMLGYLLSGSSADALNRIESQLETTLQKCDAFLDRPHRLSFHQRQIPTGKSYPKSFSCHHLILEYFDLQRHSKKDT